MTATPDAIDAADAITFLRREKYGDVLDALQDERNCTKAGRPILGRVQRALQLSEDALNELIREIRQVIYE